MSAQMLSPTKALTLVVPAELYGRMEAQARQENSGVQEVALSSLVTAFQDDEPQLDWSKDPLLSLPAIDLGITDGAEQHDHYIYGTPKRQRCRD
ncbi:MAG: hypothetical protein COZ06_36855 [Armatimonadetes bacterium CG_4_10_14_3_um_filter_66_18]|nr:hypothetical protein [Armatimonadota bacterium]OIO98707.1 MAG: hypothetical protein AUJ96_20705 [Armatimonadetes bacterium CG2_30_66_41]PIU89891.1 MAG: hypothetical protein COS65_26875 [Armatimonadetes bacterium CG06_land_8_20_14_3_00_66_21]PIX41748.1 MAG: hypothetical protein COZ57_22725 [Armatimonadetes bacterium CG_4_8_14_3_um_filter_66_20]PIY36142.1 MAG: hypothetical protein COZ06_36855 [Armatimonadetes bacterium CG_4_10_14_3_um_filter_66_18]PIZ38556.1 MAG: hypothetical protein COY42_23